MKVIHYHGSTGYSYGCRCEECRQGAAAKMRDYRQKRNGTAQVTPTTIQARDLLGVESPDWFAEAECRGAPQHIFYPHRGEPTEAAKAICARCPVSVECLAYALDHGEQIGVWGGASERERRAMRGPWRRGGAL
jgi:WhiB family transcriptional regulator, redox-sensing transcriptional regulator